MKLIKLLILATFLLAGCSAKQCAPCREHQGDWSATKDSGFYGFRWADPWEGYTTNCIPCEKAHSKEEKFVCFGDEKE